jgi:hypothetical protein
MSKVAVILIVVCLSLTFGDGFASTNPAKSIALRNDVFIYGSVLRCYADLYLSLFFGTNSLGVIYQTDNSHLLTSGGGEGNDSSPGEGSGGGEGGDSPPAGGG